MDKNEEILLAVRRDWEKILCSFDREADIKPGHILVIGCSTSEVLGHKIGKASSTEIAEIILEPLLDLAASKKIYIAVQCCEHLNRVLIVETECAEQYNLEPVIVVPSLHAGGALSLEAWNKFSTPMVVEKIQAQAGIDIGDTFIGMHLRPVVVPVRLELKTLGGAHVTVAKTRPKYVGGPRAAYPCS